MWMILACAATKTIVHPTDTAAEDSAAAEGSAVISVSSYWNNTVYVFDAAGALLGSVPDVQGAQTVSMLADGSWLVCAEGADTLLRVDPVALTATTFATDVDSPTAAVVGPDGLVYVGSFDTDRVMRYQADGTYVDDFVTAGAGGLDGPDIGLVFGPDGDLYVPGWYSKAVHRYDGATGAFKELILDADDGLTSPRALVFDTAGRLYATDWESGQIFKVEQGVTSVFVTIAYPTGMTLDGDHLLVANSRSDTVKMLDLETGDEQGVLINDDAIDGATAVHVLVR